MNNDESKMKTVEKGVDALRQALQDSVGNDMSLGVTVVCNFLTAFTLTISTLSRIDSEEVLQEIVDYTRKGIVFNEISAKAQAESLLSGNLH